MPGQRGQEGADLGRAQGFGVAKVVEVEVTAGPIDVGLAQGRDVAAAAEGVAEAVEQARRGSRRRGGRRGDGRPGRLLPDGWVAPWKSVHGRREDGKKKGDAARFFLARGGNSAENGTHGYRGAHGPNRGAPGAQSARASPIGQPAPVVLIPVSPNNIIPDNANEVLHGRSVRDTGCGCVSGSRLRSNQGDAPRRASLSSTLWMGRRLRSLTHPGVICCHLDGHSGAWLLSGKQRTT